MNTDVFCAVVVLYDNSFRAFSLYTFKFRHFVDSIYVFHHFVFVEMSAPNSNTN